MKRCHRAVERLRGVPFGRCEELLLLGVIVLAAMYPILHEAIQALGPILCGQPATGGDTVAHQALIGKVGCTLGLAILVPFGARAFAGSWAALTRSSAYGVALAVAGVATATLTAYDACTGFHATQPMAEGCACWLTALVAGLSALLAVLLILGGRAFLALMREALVVILETFCELQTPAAPHFSSLRRDAVLAVGTLLARRSAGRAPPALASVFA